MNKQTTDVDRALAAIGGTPLNYRSFGPRPIPKYNPELAEIFVYNDAGVGEYHPVVVPEPELEDPVDTVLPGMPVADAAPVAPPMSILHALPEPASVVPEAVAPIVSPAALPAQPLWRDRSEAASQTSALGAEARSLSAMFNMLAGKTHGQAPAAPPPSAPATRPDTNDLFRRL